MIKPMSALSILLGLGAALGLGWAIWSCPPMRATRLADCGIWVLAGALLGGRAAYVAAAWPYFGSSPLEIPQVWLGGISGPGALGGALLFLALTAAFTRQPLALLADDLLPLALTLVVSAWLGCWLAGAAYGPLTNAWWGVPARDEWGSLALRWPLQFAGALLSLLVFGLLDLARGRRRREAGLLFKGMRRPGRASSLGLLALGIQFYGLALLRADIGRHWQGLRLEAWGGLAFAALGLLFFSLTFTRRPGVKHRQIPIGEIV